MYEKSAPGINYAIGHTEVGFLPRYDFCAQQSSFILGYNTGYPEAGFLSNERNNIFVIFETVRLLFVVPVAQMGNFSVKKPGWKLLRNL
jgi:hypothetical protein